MPYVLANLIDDCCAGRGRVKASKAKRKEVYNAVWIALNRWILDAFSRGKVRASAPFQQPTVLLAALYRTMRSVLQC